MRKEPYRCEACRTIGIDGNFGVRLEVGSWSGEDLFYARGLSGCILASQRFADQAREHRLVEVDLVPAESFVCTFGLAIEPPGES